MISNSQVVSALLKAHERARIIIEQMEVKTAQEPLSIQAITLSTFKDTEPADQVLTIYLGNSTSNLSELPRSENVLLKAKR